MKLAFRTFIFQVKEVHFEHQKSILFFQEGEVIKEIEVKQQNFETTTEKYKTMFWHVHEFYIIDHCMHV